MNTVLSSPASFTGTDALQQAAYNKIHKTAQDFEAFFLYQSMSLMMPDMSDNPVMGGGHGEKMFQGILNEKIADTLAASGGVGLAKTIEKQLLQYQETQTWNKQ